MSESDKAKQLEEIKQYFAPKIEKTKKNKIVAETRYNLTKDDRSYMNARWSWVMAYIIFDNLVGIWEMLQKIVEGLAESETETSTFKEQIQKLNKEFKKHKPVLAEFERIMKEGKQELGRYK